VANNFIYMGGNSSHGLYLYSSSNQDLYYNSVNMTSNSTQSSALYVYAGTSVNVMNNILFHKGTGFAYYVYTPATVDNSDYNDLFVYGSNVGYWNANRATLEDFKTASGKEAHSISTNPGFKSNTDLHAVSVIVNNAGTPLAEVLYDIDGAVRSLTTPDMGADEFDSTAVVGIEDHIADRETTPKKFQLYNNYPNPFNPVTYIKYELPKDVHVKLEIYDVLGKVVKTLVDEEQSAGVHVQQFDAANFASGTYFYKISAGDFKSVRKMLLNK
jgi:hypothetical protein